MTELLARMNETISPGMTLEFLIRIIAASLCGIAIGTERAKRSKEAGIRTHCVVACASAVFMILSKYSFADLTMSAAGTFFPGTRGADPARIAAQVVSGLGFLGAGVIFKNGNSVKGLTTAAGLWATAAIGMALGSGMYLVGIFTMLILLVLQVLTHKLKIDNDSCYLYKLTIVARDSQDFHDWLLGRFGSNMQVMDSSINHNEDHTTTYHLAVRTLKELEFSWMLESLNQKENVLSVSSHTEE